MTAGSDVRTLLARAVEVAEEAGRAVMAVYGGADLGTTYKPGASPVTRADLASHAVIGARLRAIAGDCPVLSEESGLPPYDERRTWSAFWLVDPLDGTKEFIKRNGEFTVNIALVENGRPTLGVVHAPALQLTYYGAHGAGAYRRAGSGRAAPISVARERGRPLRVVVSRSHADETLERFLERLGPVERVDMGSSLKLCVVADGTADLYPRLGPTMEWDTAAAHCVLEAAGGVVTDLAGRRLVYNTRDLRNPFFVAARDAGVSFATPLGDGRRVAAT